MAGLPEEPTSRAKRILANLEGADLSARGGANVRRIAPSTDQSQMALFELKDDALRESLRALDIEKMTPLQALQKLAELKSRL